MLRITFLILILGAFIHSGKFTRNSESVTWEINSISTIHGMPVVAVGNPKVVPAGKDSAVSFNGTSDGLFINSNPLAGADEFTIEVFFKPDTSSSDINQEQRFVHIQESPDKRILIELRLAANNNWFLDTFIKSGSSTRTLYSKDFLHPVGKWYRAALVYKDGIMTDFINGKKELSGKVNFSPMKNGKISLGVRQDLRSWFKGEIKKIKFWDKAIVPRHDVLYEN